jgi:hypothetical protein
MRALLIFLAVFSITTISASKVHAQPASIEDIMKELEAESKVISTQLEDRNSNPDSEARSLKMRKLFIALYGFLPEKIEKAKDEEKPGLVRAYDKFVAQEIALTSDLEGNFAANENDKAKTTMTDIGKVRREAHKLFK